MQNVAINGAKNHEKRNKIGTLFQGPFMEANWRPRRSKINPQEGPWTPSERPDGSQGDPKCGHMEATGLQNVAKMDPESVRIGTARSKGGGISVSAFFFSTWVVSLGTKTVFIFRLVFLMVSLKLFGVLLPPKWSLKRIAFRYFPRSTKIIVF